MYIIINFLLYIQKIHNERADFPSVNFPSRIYDFTAIITLLKISVRILFIAVYNIFTAIWQTLKKIYIIRRTYARHVVAKFLTSVRGSRMVVFFKSRLRIYHSVFIPFFKLFRTYTRLCIHPYKARHPFEGLDMIRMTTHVVESPISILCEHALIIQSNHPEIIILISRKNIICEM